jgi:hypothetical protein
LGSEEIEIEESQVQEAVGRRSNSKGTYSIIAVSESELMNRMKQL